MIEKCWSCDDENGNILILKTQEEIDYHKSLRHEVLSEKTDSELLEKKNKAEDVEKIVKGRIGEYFVESIYVDGHPHFLCNKNDKIIIEERIKHDGVIYSPLTKEDTPYPPYDFSTSYLNTLKKNPCSKEDLLKRIDGQVRKFIDTSDFNRLLIVVDVFLTYCQDFVDTVHYLFIVGDTESGKSTIGHLFKNIGFRTQYQTDLNYAGIYNFYGTKEEACGTIVEDEAQDLTKDRDKIRLYKNSYSRGSKQAIIVGKDTSGKKQVYYNTFGFKVFIGERVPYDKGFLERLAILRMSTGFPEANIKRPTPEQRQDLELLRNSLLFWKVSNIKNSLPNIKTGLRNRDEELWSDFIRIASGTIFEEDARNVVKEHTRERHESIQNSLEARLFEILALQIDSKYLIVFEDFWEYLTQKQDIMSGNLESETFQTYEFGNVTRYKLSKILTDKFQAKKVQTFRERDNQKHRITTYLFNPNITRKLVMKYGITLPINHIFYQDDQHTPSSKGDS